MSVNELKTSAASGTKRGAGLKFMNEPIMFNGDTSEVNTAVLWLTRMNRVRNTAKLTDEEALFLVGGYVSGKAETWWNVIGSKAASWDEFEGYFKKQYLADQEDTVN